MHPLRSVLVLSCLALSAQDDPLVSSAEMQHWVRRVTLPHNSSRSKLQAILTATFAPVSTDSFGLGMVYDNSRTRTVDEVWRERRANCLSLTAFFVAASKAIGVDAHYAVPVNTNRWVRTGNLIRHERHVVAFIPLPPFDDVVADFLPQLRRRLGTYIVTTITDARFRSLFYGNLAVENLDQGNRDEALRLVQRAIEADPSSSPGWNIRGVIEQSLGHSQDAESSYRRAIALDPKDGTPVGNMETLCRTHGRFEEAVRFRVLGAELRKKDPYFHAFLAEEAADQDRWEEAQKEIGLALKLQAHEPEFHLFQARVHLQRGRVEEATKSLEQARHWAIPEERDRFDSKLAALKHR